MELLAGINIIDMFLHLDTTLEKVIADYQTWVYLLLFAVVFCETGFVVTPFLPGDSLLFAAGSLAAMQNSVLNVWYVYIILSVAAIFGDSTNYWIGRVVGPKIFHQEKVRLLNKKHLDEAHAFYDRHGGKTIFIARFMPILRTFAPFVAGIGKMPYVRFLVYSISGTICWIGTFVLGGYFFGNIPVVKRNFTVVIMAIIVISVIPAASAFIKQKIKSRREKENPKSEARNPKQTQNSNVK
ncbi:MAG: DedA family protein [Sedimentisphaerales bacterium]|nr:DedA family protein [Sedimentisphaerales bacterium]